MISGFIARFEDDMAIIEQCNRTTVKVSRSRLPAFSRIGDFIVEDSVTQSFHVDFAITEKRRLEILRMADMLFE